jgi:antitoxin component YwqK of YwqJK toxin-antitoxin module
MLFVLALTFLFASAHAQDKEIIEERYDSLTTKSIYTYTTDSTGQKIKNGLFVKWYEDGTRHVEGSYEHGKLDGVVIEYRPDLTRKFETTYKDGDVVKEVKYDSLGLYPQGTEDSMQRKIVVIREVVRTGREVEKTGYARSGNIFVNHGPATVWYSEGGELMEKGNFLRAAPHGLMTRWRLSGIKEFEGTFVKSNRDGIWIYWNENGALEKMEIYKNGTLVDGHNF